MIAARLSKPLLKPLAATALYVRLFIRRTEGIAAIEFGFIVPIMLCMFIGTVELSQAITIDRRVSNVAASTADLVARQRTLTTATLDTYMQIITQLMSPYSDTPLQMTISNVYNTTAAPTVNKVCWVYHRSGAPANSGIAANGNYTSSSGAALPTGVLDATGGTSVVVVEVQYLYVPVMLFGSTHREIRGAQVSSFITASGINMRETFYLKPRLSASIQYNGAANCV